MKSLLQEDIEYIVHCDEKGWVIWPISKVHAHLPWVKETLCHYVTRSMVYNPILQQYWIQLKNPKKNDSSQWWIRDMGVAWHNCYIRENNQYKYLTFDENLQKEAEEEIWIQVTMEKETTIFKNKYNSLSLSLKLWSIWHIFEIFLYDTAHTKEWVWLWFIATSETELQFNDGEVIDFKWYSPKELEIFIKNHPDQYSPALKIAYEKSEIFRKTLETYNPTTL